LSVFEQVDTRLTKAPFSRKNFFWLTVTICDKILHFSL
jgi:hypothetical protein